jgi:hypothetical protein
MQIQARVNYITKVFSTHPHQWHRWVDLEFEYFGKFEVKCKIALVCDTGAQGVKFDEKGHKSCETLDGLNYFFRLYVFLFCLRI